MKVTFPSIICKSLLLASISLFSNHSLQAQNVYDTTNLPPKYEMRGVWVSTVVNLDWPSRKGLSVEQQKQEFIRLAQMHKRNGMNALFVQVRPATDAFYPSQYDPWSEYLTGTQGQAPTPFYDPLAFMIQVTHSLGMEFHAWINPYRAVFDIHSSNVAANHVTKQHPEWFVNYGKNKIFNPGLPEAVNYVTGVVKDIVNRYDVDGIHMDDYFYPYPLDGVKFHDEDAFAKYNPNHLSLSDWRRSNCDNIIKSIHNAILDLNPMVKFGVSPFGVYRNKTEYWDGSDTRALSNYNDLYADILLWLKNGWIDYVTPQLYWEIGNARADYKTLVDWWSKHTYGKDLYIGEGVYRIGESKNGSAWKNWSELPKHLQLSRETSTVKGNVFFSSKSFDNNPNHFNDSLQQYYYRKPAIVPPMKWIDSDNPDAPMLDGRIENGQLILSAQEGLPMNKEVIRDYVVYYADDPARLGKSPDQILGVEKPTNIFNIPFDAFKVPANCNKIYVAISALDAENNESELSNFIILKRTANGWVPTKGY